MARLVYTEAFIQDILTVRLAKKRKEILDRVDLLTNFPDLGSRSIPLSIRTHYGDTVRKLVVSPFDVIYEHDPDTDTVAVLGLIHQRAAY